MCVGLIGDHDDPFAAVFHDNNSISLSSSSSFSSPSSFSSSSSSSSSSPFAQPATILSQLSSSSSSSSSLSTSSSLSSHPPSSHHLQQQQLLYTDADDGFDVHHVHYPLSDDEDEEEEEDEEEVSQPGTLITDLLPDDHTFSLLSHTHVPSPFLEEIDLSAFMSVASIIDIILDYCEPKVDTSSSPLIASNRYVYMTYHVSLKRHAFYFKYLFFLFRKSL